MKKKGGTSQPHFLSDIDILLFFFRFNPPKMIVWHWKKKNNGNDLTVCFISSCRPFVNWSFFGGKTSETSVSAFLFFFELLLLFFCPWFCLFTHFCYQMWLLPLLHKKMWNRAIWTYLNISTHWKHPTNLKSKFSHGVYPNWTVFFVVIGEGRVNFSFREKGAYLWAW